MAIVQLIGKWQCGADENSPEKIAGRLDTLLALDGKIMKTEAYFKTGGKPWILSTVTYEIAVGKDLRV